MQDSQPVAENTDPTKSPDPRIARTRSHVLETAQRMLAERTTSNLTFATIAEEARVSRRTLYAHWGTIEQLMADALDFFSVQCPDEVVTSRTQHLRRFLLRVRDGVANPIVAAAILTLVAQARHAPEEEAAASALAVDSRPWLAELQRDVGPVSDDQFAQLIGPIVFQELMGTGTASDAFIEALVAAGAATLGLD